MSNQRIDQIFNERLHDGTMPVSSEVWNRLEPFLPQPKGKDRGGLILWAGAGVLIVGILAWIVGAQISGAQPQHEHRVTGSKTVAAAVTTTESSVTELVTTLEDQGSDATTRLSPEALIAKSTKVSPDVTSANSTRSDATVSQRTVDQLVIVPAVATESGLQQAEEASDMVESQDVSVSSTRDEARHSRMPFLMLGDFALTQEARALPDPAKDCYDFGGRRSGGGGVWLAEAYTGPTLSNRKLASRFEDVSSYIARRDSTESARLSWHAGVRVGYVHNSGISVRLGAHYTVVNELFDFFDGSFSQTTTRIDTFYDASGFIIDIDTVIVTQTGKRIKTTHNHFHTIDIPLLIGYQASRDHWTYGVQAGPVFNVMHAKKGDMFSVANTIVSFTDKDPMPYPAFKDQLGMSIYASLHLGRRIGYRTMVYLEPHLQHRLRSITQDNYPIEQKQTNIGLSLGLRVALN